MEKKTALGPLKKKTFQVILAPIFKLFECVCELFVPFLVKDIIDIGIANGDSYYVLTRSLLMFAFAVAGFGVTMITQYLSATVSSDYAYDLKKDLFERLEVLSSKQISDFGENKTLTLINNDSFSLQVGVNMFMRLFVRAPFLVIGTIVMSFIISPIGGFIALGSLFLCSILIAVVLLITPKKYQKVQEDLDIISTLGNDNLKGARTIRAFNKQDYESNRFSNASSSYQKTAFALSKINALINPLTFAFVNCGVLLVLYFGGFNLDYGGLSVGSITALISYLTQALTALVLFTRLITSLSKAMASKKRVDSFLAIQPDIISGPKKNISEKKTNVVFQLKDACLSYGGSDLALDKVDFYVKEGERVGIIGGTGSGKSSLVSLLERFNNPSSGKTLFYGEPIEEYDLSFLRSNMALVSQKGQIFKGTIKDNVTLDNGKYSDEAIALALKEAQAFEFVSSYKDGILHEVEEGGVNLSGGQKQRILLARCLLSNRPIVILDDSTSALDYRTDSEVRKSFKKKQGLTEIIVSQRSTSLMDCDRIYVLEHGKVIAFGSHEQLLLNCQIYKEIYQTQVAAQ